MGASAQKLAFKEVYGALQTGVVDGQENSWCNIYTQKFYEVQDGVTETNHGLLGYLVVTSKDWLDGLDAGSARPVPEDPRRGHRRVQLVHRRQGSDLPRRT